MGFIRGLTAPFRGAAFVAKHGLWGYVVTPILLNIALAVGTTCLGMRVVRERLGVDLFSSSPVTAWVVLVILSGLLGLLLFILFQPLIGAPFLDVLTERAEALVRGSVPRTSVLSAAWQAIGHGSLKVLLYAVSLLVTLAITSITGVGGIFGVALYGLFLAYDGFDYPLARRKVSFGGKWRYLVVHPGQTLGYCLGASLMYLIPFAIVVAPAFAAVGATLAYLTTDTPVPAVEAPPPTEKGPQP